MTKNYTKNLIRIDMPRRFYILTKTFMYTTKNSVVLYRIILKWFTVNAVQIIAGGVVLKCKVKVLKFSVNPLGGM